MYSHHIKQEELLLPGGSVVHKKSITTLNPL